MNGMAVHALRCAERTDIMLVAMTRAKRHLVSLSKRVVFVDSRRRSRCQCVVGDSSTVCHGGSYLKKWLAWLEANADVKYAGLE